jgi:hypothetical protein
MNINRRSNLGFLPALCGFGLIPSAVVQPITPEVERKAMELQIKKYIDDLSKLRKDAIGSELTAEQKSDIADMIIIDIEKQGVYVFTGPSSDPKK